LQRNNKYELKTIKRCFYEKNQVRARNMDRVNLEDCLVCLILLLRGWGPFDSLSLPTNLVP
jgi:hypothetical protein